MVIMALDHIRDYFHSQAYLYNPVDPTQTTIPIFFTRFITHFCAPTFCFLAGLSAFMSGRKKSKADLSRFLIKRGIWLIIMELTLVTFGWQFDPLFRINGIAVIAMLGMSMIVLAGLIHLPRRFVFILCCVVIASHNLLDGIKYPGNFLWSIFHHAEVVLFPGDNKFYIDYPIVPWFAVMGLGYCFGKFYEAGFDSNRRRKLFTAIGISATVLFFLLRWANVYGDLDRWVQLDTTTKTFMSFMNVTKYPPSLDYLLITLGPAILFLGNTEGRSGSPQVRKSGLSRWLVNFFSTFGRVPFFYYLIHLYLIHLLAAVFAQLSGFGWKLLVLPDWILETPGMKGYGFSLTVVYLVWIGVILILYPICKWYDKYKASHKEKWWLSYL